MNAVGLDLPTTKYLKTSTEKCLATISFLQRRAKRELLEILEELMETLIHGAVKS